MNVAEKTVRLLAIASGGGHWVQLRRMRPAWENCDVAYVTTKPGYRDEVMADGRLASGGNCRFYVITDANRWQKFRLLRQLLQIIVILIRERPDVVISTGAAPGYFALRISKLIGARTIWVDSVANAEVLSLAGQMAGGYADLWLTQWRDLEGSENPKRGLPLHRGSVI